MSHGSCGTRRVGWSALNKVLGLKIKVGNRLEKDISSRPRRPPWFGWSLTARVETRSTILGAGKYFPGSMPRSTTHATCHNPCGWRGPCLSLKLTSTLTKPPLLTFTPLLTTSGKPHDPCHWSYHLPQCQKWPFPTPDAPNGPSKATLAVKQSV